MRKYKTLNEIPLNELKDTILKLKTVTKTLRFFGFYHRSSTNRKKIQTIILDNNLANLEELKLGIWTKDNITKCVNDNKSRFDTLLQMGITTCSGNYAKLNKFIDKYNICTAHYTKKTPRKSTRKSDEEFFIKNINTRYNGRVITLRLKNYIEYKCHATGCSVKDEWNGKKITLHVEHIDGDGFNNELSNLTFLCPNCHTQTDTYCMGKERLKRKKEKEKTDEINRIVNKNKLSSERNNNNGLTDAQIKDKIKQRKVQRPPYQQLIQEVKDTSYVATGKKYGVSDNSIRKWIKFYEKYENIIKLTQP